MRIHYRRKLETGMTLVDVVLAVGVLGIMASGVFGSFRYGFFALELVRENQRATQIMLEKVETIRLYNWDQINDPTFIPRNLDPEDYDPQAPVGQRGVTYTGTVTITNCPAVSSYAADMRQLTLTLSWSTRGIPHTRSVTTYIAKDGIQNYLQ